MTTILRRGRSKKWDKKRFGVAWRGVSPKKDETRLFYIDDNVGRRGAPRAYQPKGATHGEKQGFPKGRADGGGESTQVCFMIFFVFSTTFPSWPSRPLHTGTYLEPGRSSAKERMVSAKEKQKKEGRGNLETATERGPACHLSQPVIKRAASHTTLERALSSKYLTTYAYDFMPPVWFSQNGSYCTPITRHTRVRIPEINHITELKERINHSECCLILRTQDTAQIRCTAASAYPARERKKERKKPSVRPASWASGCGIHDFNTFPSPCPVPLGGYGAIFSNLSLARGDRLSDRRVYVHDDCGGFHLT
ncbi:hypothetical protein CCUS01_14495 [Colletotrichum cuscutae]|uniref:Uncharacterized protein n=1 Tax=Colletotrichum cuscutae TaxID=1209917 RepID=A0AAI9Y8V6_9PEZI|nr:hypothetical protein CCUS01_14495 [Colletotrichum cuscutae]